jgi:NADPH2:quinone reductase
LRAAWYDRTGPAAEVLEVGELPMPSPGPGEVLVRVAASGINPHDTKRRAGWNGLKLAFPRVVPHADGAGTIEAVGAGVDAGRVGQRVWLHGGAPRAFGTAAAFAAVAGDCAHPLPEGVDFAAGACLGVPACTAHHAVFADGPVAGQTILVQAGAGAVGHFAVQFASQGGARVIATVSSPEKARHARDGGADAVVDYRTEDVIDRVRSLTGGRGVDRIIEVDFGANLDTCAALIRENGVIAAYSSTAVPNPTLPYYAFAHKGATLRFIQGLLLTADARRAAVADIDAGLSRGTVKVTVARSFPLAGIAKAHAYLESGQAMGKVVVTVR